MKGCLEYNVGCLEFKKSESNLFYCGKSQGKPVDFDNVLVGFFASGKGTRENICFFTTKMTRALSPEEKATFLFPFFLPLTSVDI